MATWHQQKAAVNLYSEDKWTVVTDPPNQMRFLQTFETALGAREFIENLTKHQPEQAAFSYILPPANAQRVLQEESGDE